MIPKEILRRVNQIEIQTRSVVNNLFAGEYHSVFKGQGMEFAEVREYQAGDEVRSIDWNVTARVGRPFVKIFDEERELTVVLVVDASASGAFGSGQRMKGEAGVEISALLAFSAIINNDRVGLLIFTEDVEVYIPPKKGRKHVLRVIRELLYFQPRGTGTSIAGALEYVNRLVRRRSVFFLISDFIDRDYARALKLVRRRHDLICITLVDPRERELPDMGFLSLRDTESGEQMLVDTGSPEIRRQFADRQLRLENGRADLFRRLRIDEVKVDVSQSYLDPLVRFFQTRMMRRC